MVLGDSPTASSGGSVTAAGGPVVAAAANSHPRLYKVPVDQRRANPDAYTPFLFSFGPYHALLNPANGQASTTSYSPVAAHPLLDGRHLKLMTAAGLLSPQADDQLTRLADNIAQHEAQIRAQYVQWLDMEGLDFRRLVGILALDGLTIVAATLSQEVQRQQTPLIYPLARLVLSDAMLLENQVPIIVLECALRSLAQRSASPKNILPADPLPSLEDVILWYCKRSSPFPEWTPQRLLPLEGKAKGEPLLSFLYDYLFDRLKPSQQDPDQATRRKLRPSTADVDPSLPTASQLAMCGVGFRPCDSGEVRFDSTHAVLLLPRITVSDTTVRVLHNLLAYEATLRHPKQYTVVSYVHFIDCLIDNVDDVEILTEGGIINNKLSSHEELASMWNKLCVSVNCRNTISNHIVMAQLDALSKERWRRWRASFVDMYWNKQPWLLFSIFAAIILFGLSLLQTIYTILAY